MTATFRQVDRLVERLCGAVRADRLTERALALVRVPSPSGHEAAVADIYAGMLSECGLSVEIDREFPESPSVVARPPAALDGPVVQLDGHLDTVSTPHGPPSVSDGTIHGRGSCDMKGGLAAIAEVAGILTEFGVPLGGSFLVTAHGQHEEAANDRPLHAPLVGLLRRGIKGDVCLIPEGPHAELPVAGRGLVIFKVHFERPGEPVHEILSGPVPPPNPLTACHRFVSMLEERSKGWGFVDRLAGPESFFIGSVNGGDYYNRVPNRSYVWGTRRYPNGQVFETVRDELVELAGAAAASVGCRTRIEIEKSGQPFSIAEDHPLVVALRHSHSLVVGTELPLAGMPYSADASQFIHEGGIPALYHGTDSATAHSDAESVAIADLARCTKVLIGAVCGYLGVREEP